MQVNPQEVVYHHKVGQLDGKPVIEVGLKGGLHLIFRANGKSLETLGAGPHRAVARFVAKKKTEDKIEWQDLSKSDYIEPEHFADILPQYEAYTDALREIQGLK